MSRLFALILVCCSAGLADSQERHSEQRGATNGAICLQPLSNFPAAWSLCPVQSTPIEKVETDWRYPNCAYPNSHDEADLCEQRKMSASADWSVFLGWWQLALSVLGFVALIYTLALTRNATNAAIESNKIARDTAKRELRAYLPVESAEVRNLECGTEYFIQFRNFGQTPAYQVTGWGALAMQPHDFSAVGAMSCFGDIPPGGQVHIYKRAPRPLTLVETINLKSGLLEINFFGEINYFDAFGETRATKFRRAIGYKDWISHYGKMGICREGNQSD